MKYNNHQQTSILFIDSGIGGLSTLATASKVKFANYIYFADNLYSPYGTKTDEFLKQRLFKIIDKFSKKFNISIVVLACNTATTTAISFLRETFPDIIFIGTEPAYKIAIDNKTPHPALIATPQTINHLQKNKLNNFLLIPHKDFAGFIEETFTKNSPKAKFYLLKTIYQLKKQTTNCDNLILGCTHYVIIKDKISKILNLPVLDGNFGVAKQILKNTTNYLHQKSNYKIYLSLKNSALKEKYKKILEQILANQINLC